MNKDKYIIIGLCISFLIMLSGIGGIYLININIQTAQKQVNIKNKLLSPTPTLSVSKNPENSSFEDLRIMREKENKIQKEYTLSNGNKVRVQMPESLQNISGEFVEEYIVK